MRFTALLACGLLAACGSGSVVVLSAAQESPLPAAPQPAPGPTPQPDQTVSDPAPDFDPPGVEEFVSPGEFVPVAAGEVGYVSFGLLLNDERIDAGIATVTENSVLNGIAQDHAEDQVRNNYLDHTSLDGSNVGDRALAGGYNYRFIAENIARGFDDEGEVIDAWMASPGHQENILDTRAEEFGLGREESTWVLLLGTEFPDAD